MRRLALFGLLGLLWAQPASATWTAIGHHIQQASGCTDFQTTVGKDTSAADLIVVGIASGSTTATVTDTSSNSYTTQSNQSDTVDYRFSYAQGAGIGSASMKWTVSTGNNCATILIAWFSGSTGLAVDGENGNGSGGLGSAGPLTSNAVTTTVNGDLIVTGAATNGGAPNFTTDSPAGCAAAPAITDQAGLSGGNAYGGALAWCVQTSSGSIAVAWSQAAANFLPIRISTFKAAAGGGGCTASPGSLLLLGVGNCKGN